MIPVYFKGIYRLLPPNSEFNLDEFPTSHETQIHAIRILMAISAILPVISKTQFGASVMELERKDPIWNIVSLCTSIVSVVYT